jgi:hypothetical protein
MRGFIEEDSNAFPTPQTAELDRIARRYFSQPNRPQDQLASYVANFFIRQWDAPLKQYMMRHYYPPKSAYEDIVAWGKSAVVFDQYGKFLIKRHPLAYARYYLLVNSKNYFIPPLEKLEIYNLGSDELWPEGQYWFHYPPKIRSISKPLQGAVLGLFPLLFLILNAYYAVGLFLFIKRGGFRKVDPTVRYTILTISVFLGLNAAFSIFANIVVIRYEVFPMLVFLTFAMMLTDYLEILASPQPMSVPPLLTGGYQI